jgi:hypothetical protein
VAISIDVVSRGDGGAAGGMWETVGSVKMVFVCVSLQNDTVTVSSKCYNNYRNELHNDTVTVTVSSKCYNNFHNELHNDTVTVTVNVITISIMNCSQQHKQNECNCKWKWMLKY